MTMLSPDVLQPATERPPRRWRFLPLTLVAFSVLASLFSWVGGSPALPSGVTRFPAPGDWFAIWSGELAGGADGSLWAIVHNGDAAVGRLDGAGWELVDVGFGLSAADPIQIASDLEGPVWVLYATGDVARFEDGEWTKVEPTPDVGEPQVIGVSADGTLWALTRGNRLIRLEGSTWTTVDRLLGMSLAPSLLALGRERSRFDDVHPAVDQMVWVGGARSDWNIDLRVCGFDGSSVTCRGVPYEILPEGVEMIDTPGPLPPEQGTLTVHTPSALAVDTEGSVWQAALGGVAEGYGFAVVGAGVFRLADGQWTYFGVEDGFDRGLPHQIVVTDTGAVWAGAPSTEHVSVESVVSGGGALYRFDEERWVRVLDGSVIQLTTAPGGVVWALMGAEFDAPAEFVRLVP